MEDSDEWTDVVAEAQSPPDFLFSAGLSQAEVAAIVDAAGIVSMKDFSLMDDSMLDEVTKVAGLKLIPARKLANAIKTLCKKQHSPPAEAKQAESAGATSQETTEVEDPTKQNNLIVDECVVIAIDRSGSMGCGFDEAPAFGLNAEKTLTRRSRQDAVKQCFYAFRDRTEALDTKHQLGLVQFDNRVEEMLPVTSDLDKFEAVVDDMRPRASTAIYSAILHGCAMLEPHNSPETDLRILVLTDGQNNAGATPSEALKEVQKIGAVVDAMLVGDTPDVNLRKIVTASGGTCFQVHSLSDGFELMEAESVVSLRSRRGGGDRPPIKPSAPVNFHTIQVKTITHASQAASVSTAPDSTSGNRPKWVQRRCVKMPAIKNGTLKRLAKELGGFVEDKSIHLYADENDPYHLMALIEGSIGTPFEGGVFLLDIGLPSDYPFKPPKIHYKTPIFHCNVNSNGGICLPILKDQWSPRETVEKCLRGIQEMMANPNTDDALRPTIAELCFAHRQSGGNDIRYFEQAKAATKQDACRTVEAWEAHWGITSVRP